MNKIAFFAFIIVTSSCLTATAQKQNKNKIKTK